ncbi:MAG: hypothetical protein DYG92_14425 [Leptolyngbya sp. PLA1]|nr:hypothetical protein [Leptolyngbya sp. PLA1]
MRLWQSLERVQGWAGVRSVWREHMGDELQFLQPLLRPMEELAMSVPWPGTIEGRKVVVHDEDDIVAVDRETSEASPITRDDIVLWQLDADTLFRGVAAALGLSGTPSSVGMGNRLWWLGDYVPVEGERFPVYLATTRDAQSLLRSAGHVSALSQRPFVLVTPTRAGASEELNRVVEGRSSAWITLAETLSWQGEGMFEPKQPVEDVLRRFVNAHVKLQATANTARFPTPPGATWPEVRIRFLDGHTVAVQVRDRSGRHGFADMGMVNSKNNTPTVAWELLRAFAEERGHLTWSSRKASADNRKRKQTLADRLRAFFGIDEDPFELLDGGWRARFRLESDS